LSPHREYSAVGDDQRHDDEGHAIPHFVALVFTVWQMLLQRDFEPSSEQPRCDPPCFQAQRRVGVEPGPTNGFLRSPPPDMERPLKTARFGGILQIWAGLRVRKLATEAPLWLPVGACRFSSVSRADPRGDDYSVFLTNTQSGDRGQTTSFHNTDVERGRAPGFIGVQAYYGASRSIMRANGIAIARREMGPQSSQLNCGARCHTGSTALGRQPCRRPLPLPKALRFAATEPQIFSDSARRSASSRRAGKT
jgi:hypothetical protein